MKEFGLKRVTFDFETRSACDLKRAGAYQYSLDPSTQPTCMAFKMRGNAKIYFLDFKMINTPWKNLPEGVRTLWERFIDRRYEFAAHNAFFETVIYKNILVKRYGWPDIPFTSFRCTAAKAAACALPRSLEGAGAALKLSTQKDRRGYAAMMATCKPTKAWNNWKTLQADHQAGKRLSAKKLIQLFNPEPPKFLEPEMNPVTWATLYEYCKIDVKTEELLDITLPDLTPNEQQVWFLNQKLNWRGIRIDIPVARKIVGIMLGESKSKLKELDSLTMGLVTKAGARASILEFLKLEGVELPDIRAKTVEDALKDDGLSGDMRRLLEIRKALSKTSTKKYQGMLDRAGDDHRVRDLLLYHGASTGRDSGTGVQFQNLPRPLIPQTSIDTILELLQEPTPDVAWLKVLYGDNLSIAFSALLRGMLIPSQGCELFVADFAKIEVAVLWWLSDNKPGLWILNSGLDPYKYMAAANTGKRYEDISDDGEDRQLGKAQILGAGFGMGWEKFKATAHDLYRLTLTETQSREAIDRYRKVNSAVTQLWKDYEQAAIFAIEENKSITVGKCKFFCCDQFLWVMLPSGRRLAYREPQISWRETDYGPRKTVEFLGLGLTKRELKLERTWGGTLTENIVQAVARDLMARAIIKLDQAGYQVLLTVHDEIICEVKQGKRDLEEFRSIMVSTPEWADSSLPLDAKAWAGGRYRK